MGSVNWSFGIIKVTFEKLNQLEICWIDKFCCHLEGTPFHLHSCHATEIEMKLLLFCAQCRTAYEHSVFPFPAQHCRSSLLLSSTHNAAHNYKRWQVKSWKVVFDTFCVHAQITSLNPQITFHSTMATNFHKFEPNFTVSTKFHNFDEISHFDQISQFQPSFRI